MIILVGQLAMYVAICCLPKQDTGVYIHLYLAWANNKLPHT